MIGRGRAAAVIAHVAFLVREYDEAIRFFIEKLGFRLMEDTPMGEGKRWVLVAPSGRGAAGGPGMQGTSLLLARAANEDQARMVGNQGGGRVFLFLHTEDFTRDYEGMRARGVVFLQEPRSESYGSVVVFQDLYGNKWDLLGPKVSGP
jgi:catechol 2,3-dioxygenase-like lactoylglutathione lyase family enzyme